MIETLLAYAPTFGAVLLVNLLGWMSPGPNMMVVASSALSQGTRAGIVTGCGVALGGLVWASLAVLGVGLVFEALPALFMLLKIAGGGYLIWLGVRHWRRAMRGQPPGAASGEGRAFARGLAVVLTNPKAILFFGAVFSAVIPADAPVWLLLVLLAVSQIQSILQHAITAALFGSRAARAGWRGAGASAERAVGAVFVALGAGVIWHTLRRA